MVKFSALFISFMLIGVIIYGLFSFIDLSQEQNNIENKFVDDPLINKTYKNLETDLSSLSEQSQAQKTLFESENPTSGFGTILIFSIVSAGKIFNGMMIGLFNTLINLPTIVLGIDPIIISVINTILIITIIIGLWVLYKLGG